ncbi:sensor histidine kinase [Macrococcus hajekii]|uniref:Sensor histidine kinase n=1 Tax=Macrococcus hajekii TaxID=198482 RepID=A0A4R6BIH8_9STAP|nr:sensor histidine kinase [Macrococcus hajekii]TDM01291.1 sensor histidine kinase [Macrococcus hajekii]GGB10373.1 sensor protein VraS [Macrococcus hajekii]
MNNYTRFIGVMLILVYSLLFVFYVLDRIFTNIIYFQGMLNSHIVGVPALLLLNVIVILSCIIMGSLVAYKQNEQYAWLKEQIRAIDDGYAIRSSDHIELHPETEEVMTSIIKLNETLRTIKYQNQIATSDVNEQIVKKIVEEERQRLARELHDSVSQQLFAASMMLSALKTREVDTEMGQQIDLLERMLHEAQQEMRALLLHLRPLALQNKSLIDGITDLTMDLKQKTQLDIQLDLALINLTKGIEDQLFRITQEAISNTLRHAHAERLVIELFQIDGSLILRIADDGKGFDMALRDETRYGINTMKERALEIGGSCQIISAPESGTRIEIKVPINEEDEHESIIRR